jgi:SAM-dependent methyltransferase
MGRLSLLMSLPVSLAFLAAVDAQTGAQPVPRQAAAPIPEVLFIPTPDDIVTRMLELAKVGKEDVVYDLGCGDGRILVAAVKKYHCRAVGFDIDPRRVKDSRENLRKNSVENLASAEEKDLFDVDLRPASVITLYLSPKYNARLIPKLEQLKPGSRIVSHLYGIEGIEPDQVRDYKSEKDEHVHTLYLWTTPLRKKVAGGG